MLNIKYRLLYNSPWGLFEGVPYRVKNTKHLNNLKNGLYFFEAIGICFYCNNKPVLLKWK